MLDEHLPPYFKCYLIVLSPRTLQENAARCRLDAGNDLHLWLRRERVWEKLFATEAEPTANKTEIWIIFPTAETILWAITSTMTSTMNDTEGDPDFYGETDANPTEADTRR